MIYIRILYAFLIMNLAMIFQSCQSNASKEKSSMGEEEKGLTVKVGSKSILTNKYTNKQVPVVPMWDAPMPNDDWKNGAGFPVLENAMHASVWQPSSIEDGAYNHYSCLIHYKGKFYAMWGNHSMGEDAPGQRVLFSSSEKWGNWENARELFPAPGPVKPRKEKGIHLKPDRWVIVNDELYAVVYVHGAGRYPIARKVDEQGMLGDPFLLKNLPDNAQLPVFMAHSGKSGSFVKENISNKIFQWYSDNHQVSWWAAGEEGVNRKAVDGADLIETFAYKAKDGNQVLFLRNWGHSRNPVHNNRLYVSFKDSNGKWGQAYPTDIPDSPSRAQALTLKDGTVLLIGNQNTPELDQAVYLDRDPMTVSISRDGYKFTKAFAFRTGAPTSFRFQGVGGRNPGFAYSSSLIHQDTLFTLYSIGKEDIAISKVPLVDLGIH